jgi:hypothetical protein
MFAEALVEALCTLAGVSLVFAVLAWLADWLERRG